MRPEVGEVGNCMLAVSARGMRDGGESVACPFVAHDKSETMQSVESTS